ncbi:MAG: hypothetical protein ACOYL6_05475 [Bacteriovoracaceae bacterium]
MKRMNAEKTIARISSIGSALPLIWLSGVFIFYIRARIYLGYWPHYATPDPKSLPFVFHHWILMITVFVLFSTLLILPIFWLVQFKFFKLSIRKQMLSYGIGVISLAITLNTSGFNFVTWFLD